MLMFLLFQMYPGPPAHAQYMYPHPPPAGYAMGAPYLPAPYAMQYQVPGSQIEQHAHTK